MICFTETIGSSLYYDDSHLYVTEAIQEQTSFLTACEAPELCSRGAIHTDHNTRPLQWTLELGDAAALPDSSSQSPGKCPILCRRSLTQGCGP